MSRQNPELLSSEYVFATPSISQPLPPAAPLLRVCTEMSSDGCSGYFWPDWWWVGKWTLLGSSSEWYHLSSRVQNTARSSGLELNICRGHSVALQSLNDLPLQSANIHKRRTKNVHSFAIVYNVLNSLIRTSAWFWFDNYSKLTDHGISIWSGNWIQSVGSSRSSAALLWGQNRCQNGFCFSPYTIFLKRTVNLAGKI